MNVYFTAIQQFSKTLKNLDAILEKATQYAEHKKFDVNNFCTARLSPDMFTFVKQIQVACDVAKGAVASFTGKESPKHEDVEKTIPECRERIRKVVAFLESTTENDYSHLQPKTVCKIAFPAGKAMHAEECLFSRVIPNFYFHVSMAYALLRQGGVDIGKMDYLGKVNVFDA